MVELDQFKYTLSTYEAPLKEVRDSLNLDAKIRRIDELDKTMEEISAMVGFANRQSFYAAFYKILGITPRSYRMSYLAKEKEAAKA